MLITCPNCGETTDADCSETCFCCGEKLKSNELSCFDKNELVCIDELPEGENQQLMDAFFKEYPELKPIEEKGVQLNSAMCTSFKTPAFLKISYLLTSVCLAIGLLIMFTKSPESGAALIFLGVLFAAVAIVGNIITSKKTDKAILLAKLFFDSPEWKDYEKIRAEWLASKGFYFPE